MRRQYRSRLFQIISLFIVLMMTPAMLPSLSAVQGIANPQLHPEAIDETIIIDDGCPGTDPPGFERERPAAQDPWICISVQRQVYWAYGNNDALYSATNGSPVSWVGWRPTIATAGRYKVEVSIPSYNQGQPKTQQANYTIQHADGVQAAQLDQSAYAGQWVDLGTYRFGVGTSGYVHISSGTTENPWRVIDADAARFTLVSYDDSVNPDGNITSPTEGSNIGPGTVNITADAWDNSGGSGVNRVEFYVRYDGSWHHIGNDNGSPYAVSWSTPSSLHSQQVRFAIHVVDNAGNTAIDPGGVRTANFIESQNPSVSENWVPANKRAYLNQRAITPNGDKKCSVASMAMLLAMNGFIGTDHNTMAAKANEMYPRVLGKLPDGSWAPYIYKMRDELRRQGAASDYYNVSANQGWNIIKQEVNAGRPVMVRTAAGVVTGPGHILVAVGYRESSGKREMITYDPFGRWLGTCCTNNYDRNTTDPNSHKGRWVFYNFDTLFGSSNYLVTARNPTARIALSALEDEPSTPPDEVSDESEDIGTYEGDEIATGTHIFLPLVVKGN